MTTEEIIQTNKEKRQTYKDAYNETIIDASKQVWNYLEKQKILGLTKKYDI